jgi:hypothetical protein
MAPRRGADRLLAIPAKAAGARALFLAFAAAAALLCLAGCGGGGEDSTSVGAAQQGDTTTETEAKSPDSAAGQGQAAKERNSGAPSGSQQGFGANLPEGEREPGITPQQRRKATTADIRLESPAFKGGSPLPARFTCEGEEVSPPLRWSGVPADAEELVLLALNLLPVKGALFFDWAVAGIDPSLTELEEGELSSEAILGTNGFGKRSYGLCPQVKGEEERYIFMLYAIPEALNPKPGFDPLVMREEVLAQSGNVGLLATAFTRR